MTPFEIAIAFTLEIESGGDPEGGFNDRPSDRGGPTKFGISKRAHPDVDIRNLTRDQAIEIYREWYWAPAKCEKMPGPVAVAHFDCAVNSGPWQAGKLLQRAVGAEVDGWVGPRTIEALRRAVAASDATTVAERVIEARTRYVADLVDEPEKARERQNLMNLEGWAVRLVRLTALVCRTDFKEATP